MPVTLRSAALADAIAIHGLLSDIIAEGEHLMSIQAPDLAHFTRFVDANLSIGAPVWVAEKGGRVIGWCDVYPRGQDVQRHVGRLGMGLARAHRGRGVGQRLLTATVEAAWQAGFQRLELEVFASNRAAVALYERMGFAHEGRHRCVRRIQEDGKDRYQDTLTMALLHPGLV